MTDDTTDVRKPLSPDELAQLRKLFEAAWDIAQVKITEIAGRDFLGGLMADQQGEIVINIALKGRLARVCVNWPELSPTMQTICDLHSYSDPKQAN